MDPFFEEKLRNKPYDKSLDVIKWNKEDLKAVKQIEVFKHIKYFMHLGILTENTFNDKMQEDKMMENDSPSKANEEESRDVLEDEVNQIKDYLDQLKEKTVFENTKSIPVIKSP